MEISTISSGRAGGGEKRSCVRDSLLNTDDVFELVEEPRVDVGELVDLLDGPTGVESVRDGEQATVGRLLQLLVDFLKREGVLPSFDVS